MALRWFHRDRGEIFYLSSLRYQEGKKEKFLKQINEVQAAISVRVAVELEASKRVAGTEAQKIKLVYSKELLALLKQQLALIRQLNKTAEAEKDDEESIYRKATAGEGY